jgi:tetrapyrrole methylase family protein / MazG family protein
MSLNNTSPRPPASSEFDRAAIEAIREPHARLRVIMKRLLDPGGCPWDREQTHATLKQYLIEEAYEVCESIDEGDMASLREELGDVGLQVVFHAELAERAGAFTIEEVYAAICTKLLDRHPHVFGETHAADAAAVLKNWEEIKREEKRSRAEARGEGHPSVLDGVPKALPALQRALRLQEKASRVGFDWNAAEEVEVKVREEVEEFLELGSTAPAERLEEEFGDLLFSLVNLSRFLSIRPEEALAKSCAKFVSRFHHIEARARSMGREIGDMTLEELDSLWDEAKQR